MLDSSRLRHSALLGALSSQTERCAPDGNERGDGMCPACGKGEGSGQQRDRLEVGKPETSSEDRAWHSRTWKLFLNACLAPPSPCDAYFSETTWRVAKLKEESVSGSRSAAQAGEAPANCAPGAAVRMAFEIPMRPASPRASRRERRAVRDCASPPPPLVAHQIRLCRAINSKSNWTEENYQGNLAVTFIIDIITGCLL